MLRLTLIDKKTYERESERELSSNSSQMRYIHLYTDTLGKGMTLSPHYGLNSS